jgi:penicillin-binding protein 1C
MFKRNRYKLVLFLLASWLLLRAAVRIFPGAPLSSRFSSSTAVYDANHKLLRLTLSADQKYRLWAPLENISPRLVEAIGAA